MTIRELRAITKLSQNKFAEMFCIPTNTLQRWEQGIRKPPKYVVFMVEELLKCKGHIKDEDNK